MKNRKITDIFLILFVVAFVGLVGYGLYYHYFVKDKLIQKYGIWTIGTVYKREGGGRGGGFYLQFTYSYKNQNYKGRSVVLINKAKNATFTDKRFLVRLLSNKPEKADVDITYPVPDSIRIAPSEGWKELPSWANKKEYY